MDADEKNCLNSLLFYLRSFEVVELVRAHYAKYGNDSPPYLLEKQIEEAQKLLEKKSCN